MQARIESVHVIPPSGVSRTPAKAIRFIKSVEEPASRKPSASYEVGIRYSNGNEVRGQFNDKAAAITFLRGMR